MPDEITIDYACEVLNREHDKPFFIGVGLTKPHTPLYVPEKYYDRFPIDDVTLPPYLENDLDDCAEALRNRWEWGFQKFEALIKAGGEQAWKEFVQAYLATIAFVDDQVGKLMDTLESEGYADDTIIVFTSDNGYHLGEKDCIQKWHLWNESTRLPFLIRVPGMKGMGSDCSHPVSHIDLYPTLIELCNLPAQPHKDMEYELDGHSLAPFLQGKGAHSWSGPAAALVAIRDAEGPTHFSVCSDRYRYTLCENGEEELYDHETDPHEWTNLADRQEHAQIRKEHRKTLLHMLKSSKIPEDYTPGFQPEP
jgi:arylsulfatase A-like enzyme